IRKNHVLPTGMEIEPYYDRDKLVKLTTDTVLENLLVGMLLVTLVLWVFLGQARAAAVAAVNIPLALTAAFCGMVFTGTPANLISLGAVDIGIIIEPTVIMVENVYRHLGPRGRGTLKERIAEAAGEIGGPLFFSTLIITLAFVPLFTMTGVAGVIFSPMAHTYAFAIGGAVVLSVALTPVLAAWALRVDTESENREGREEAHGHDNRFLRWVDRVYRPLVELALRRRRLAVALALSPLIPQGEWRRGITKDKLTQQLSRELREAFPGVDFNFSQAIADNVEEAMSGVKGENTVKVVGPDLKVNEQRAAEIVSILHQIRG